MDKVCQDFLELSGSVAHGLSAFSAVGVKLASPRGPWNTAIGMTTGQLSCYKT
jgi:hypothetical protein